MQEFATFASQHAMLFVALIAILLLLAILESIRKQRYAFCIAPRQVTQLINHERATIIDIRTNNLYQQSRIIDALSIQPVNLYTHKKLEKLRARPIVIVCVAGIESKKIALTLRKEGYNAYSLAGGMQAWLAASMPTIKGTS